jgi:hypothetical protein
MSKESKTIESLIKMEENLASELSASVNGLHLVFKEVLNGIAYDSLKHAGFYKAILSLLKGENLVITEEQYSHLEKVIKDHIDVENRAIHESKQLLEAIQDSRIQHLLKEIYEDEVNHHKLMKRILEAVIRKDDIFDAEFWDTLWSGVHLHMQF